MIRTYIVLALLINVAWLPAASAGLIEDTRNQASAMQQCAISQIPENLFEIRLRAGPDTECIVADKGLFCWSETRKTTSPNGAVDEYRTEGCLLFTENGYEVLYTCNVHNHYNDPEKGSYTTMVPEGCAS